MWLYIRQEGLAVSHEAESILGTVGSSVSWGVKNTKGWKSVSVIGFSQDNLTGVQNWIAGVQEHGKKKKTHIILFFKRSYLVIACLLNIPSWKLSLHTKVFSLSLKFTETIQTEQVRFFKLLKLFYNNPANSPTISKPSGTKWNGHSARQRWIRKGLCAPRSLSYKSQSVWNQRFLFLFIPNNRLSHCTEMASDLSVCLLYCNPFLTHTCRFCFNGCPQTVGRKESMTHLTCLLPHKVKQHVGLFSHFCCLNLLNKCQYFSLDKFQLFI